MTLSRKFSPASPLVRRLPVLALLAALGSHSWASDDQPQVPAAAPPPAALLSWNDLGMHCMDPDFAVFTILPPFNTINSQLMINGKLQKIAASYTVEYDGVADANGSINTTSMGKTSFWDHVLALFGVSLPVDIGLAGHNMPGPGNTPQPVAFDETWDWFHAEGIPITPLDDALAVNRYPLLRFTAKDAVGNVLDQTSNTAPVSTELECSLCHSSAASPEAMPASGWVFDPDVLRDDRLNILKLHDQLQANDPLFASSLAAAGYDSAGLLATANGGTSILCASCHTSNALPGTGLPGVSALTSALHLRHADVFTPDGETLNNEGTRASCFTCHPGNNTQCLRGAMGAAIAADGQLAIECQSCHGDMNAVGDPARVGWLEQPDCQSCHTGTATNNSGAIRFASVFDENGVVHSAADPLFATTNNVPGDGFNLYRFSTGHGGLQCAACHGSPHAIYPSSEPNDNVQSEQFQGHAGTVVECDSCHGGQPDTEFGGPHRMHPIGQEWATEGHKDPGEHDLATCRQCHGQDLRGSVLSRTHDERTIYTSDFGTQNWFAGANVTCFVCHQGPFSEDESQNAKPIAQSASTTTPNDLAKTINLMANDPNGQALDLRIVKQPQHGSVGLAGTVATYLPQQGYVGPDPFTFAAFDGTEDSNLATVSVQVTSASCAGSAVPYGFGCPGEMGLLPVLTAQGCPEPGSLLTLTAHGGVPGGTALLVFGVTQGTAMLPEGCVLRVDPLLPGIIALPVNGLGDATVSAVLPPSLSGIDFTAQMFLLGSQPGAVGRGATNGLAISVP